MDFTEEEWMLMDSDQRALCREVTLEAFKNIIDLGKSLLCSGFHSLGKEGFFQWWVNKGDTCSQVA